MNSILRSTLKYLFRGTAFKRRLPGGTRIFVTTESQLAWLKPGRLAFDSELLRIVDEFILPNSIVWDIGANIGVFSFAAAAKGAKVLAIEADPVMVSLMLRSKALPSNKKLKLEVLSAAVSDRAGVSKLQFSPNGRAGNALVAVIDTQPGRKFSKESVLVPTVTLDKLLSLSNPSFVKIDVEGAELLVLQGASRLLENVRPTIYCECYKENATKTAAIFHRYRYKLFDGSSVAPRKQISLPEYNTLAVPE